MKYCKEELKIIPKRLMVFDGSHFFQQKKESDLSEFHCENGHDIPEEYHSHDHIHSPTSRNMHTKDTASHQHDNNSPVDDSIGRIKRLVIGYTYYTNPSELNAFNKIYSDLVIKLSRTGEWSSSKKKILEDDTLKLSSIAPDKDALKNLAKVNDAIKTLAEFTGDYMRKDDSLNILGNSLSTQIWIQDDIIPARDENNKIILYGRLATDISNSRDNCPARALSIAIECEHKMIPDRQLAGGNMLFIGPYILVGHNSLIIPKSAACPQGGYYTADKLERNLARLFKEPKVVVIGNQENEYINDSYRKILQRTTDDIAWLNKEGNSQPIFHLDLFITPAGLSQNGKYRVVVGDPITLLDRDETELLRKGGLFDKTRSAINRIANQLSQYPDLEVSRIPLPLSWVDLVDEKVKKTKRLWFFASYNNSLVQYTGQDSEENYVLLPKYGNSYSMEKSGYAIKIKKGGIDQEIEAKSGDWSELKEFENQVRKHWNHLGFKVVFLTDYLPMIIQRGALRCMIKVIDREVPEVHPGISKINIIA